jgi:hypothetical protein
MSETSPKLKAEQRELSGEGHPGRAQMHLVLRYSDSLFRIRNVLERHTLIANRHGAVRFGKIGQAIGQASGRALQDQIANGTPTFVFLVPVVIFSMWLGIDHRRMNWFPTTTTRMGFRGS